MEFQGTTVFDRDEFVKSFENGSLAFELYSGAGGYPSFSLPGMICHTKENELDFHDYQLLEVRQTVPDFPKVKLTLYLPVHIGRTTFIAFDRYELSSSQLTIWEDVSKRLKMFSEDYDDHKTVIHLEGKVKLYYTETFEDYKKSWNKCFELIEKALKEKKDDNKDIKIETSKKEVIPNIQGRSDITLYNLETGIQVLLDRKKLPYTARIWFMCSVQDLCISLLGKTKL